MSGEGETAQVRFWRISGVKDMAKALLMAGLPAAWGWRLCFEADPSGVDGKLWLGSTVVIASVAFGARPIWQAIRIERRAIRRQGELLVIELNDGRAKRVSIKDVTSVGLGKVTKAPERDGGGLVVREAGAMRDVEEKAERLRPEGTGVRIRLKSKEEIFFGNDLGPRRTDRLLRALKDRFGLPVEGI
ncbi:MAG: hypothetical protein FD126_1494 [Elusimicrobia bacterium]|nr:MAG: hypothetical protein FD126_1494 [Elusimicrobiota bacterium]